MNPLTKVRDKFLYEAGIVADKNNPRYDEQLVNTAILTPICAIDLAYGMYQNLDKTFFKQDCKRWYNEMQTKFHAIFAPKTGILYRGLTDDEILAACDFMDKIAEEVKHDTDILWWQIQQRIMHYPQKEREIVGQLMFIMIICCYTIDMLERNTRTKFVELEYISHRAGYIIEHTKSKLFGKKQSSFEIDDEQFIMTLKVLFNNLGRIASGEKQL